MNPFAERPECVEKLFENWQTLYPRSYDKNAVDPYTKTRIILMNGTEFESNWFSHNFERHTTNTDLRRELALTRYLEKQQQLKLSLLKPIDESALEHTIGYEQLAVDLTAELAKRVGDAYLKKALDFALLEDFDHLYRYANRLEADKGVLAEKLVGRYTEIMPGRPTIAHHRHPADNVRRSLSNKVSDKMSVLAGMIITAAEQQTMNYYMNIATLAENEQARRLYEEIALVEEEHVTHYEGLMDAGSTWLESLLLHEYVECYLYWSCYMTETDEYIRSLWERNFVTEVAHLHKAKELLGKYENKDVSEVIPDAEFPEPLSLHENIDYVRKILQDTVQFTSHHEDYADVNELPSDSRFFKYQQALNADGAEVPSHCVIEEHIRKDKKDYRFEVAPTPVKALRSNTEDNVSVGRVPGAATSKGFASNA